MWMNYGLTAWRHFLKNRLFSLINIFGLAVGLASCLLIMLFVRSESGYDTWIPEYEKVVRLHSAFYPADGRPPFLSVRSAGRMKNAILQEADDLVEAGVRLHRQTPTINATGSADLFAETVTFADASLFDVLDLPFAHGDAETAFTKPLDLVITEEMAIKYFGRTDAIGETFTVCCLPSGPLQVAVSGVLKDIPENSHLDIDFLTVMEERMFAFAPNILDTWNSVNTFTYFKLKDGVTAEDLRVRYYNWLDSDASPFYAMMQEVGKPGEKVTDFNRPSFMPIADIYLNAQEAAGSIGDFRPLGDAGLIQTFAAVALLILLIAGINFTNLSTARATRRAREVAMRKTLGATRGQVAVQFLVEAVALALVSVIVAMVAVELALPTYSEMLARDIGFSLSADGDLIGVLFVGAVLVGLISGAYPAFVLSKFMPAKTLKSNQSSDGEATGSLRAALVVFQFAVSIGLAVCTAVVYGQTLFARNIDTGYSIDNKLVVYSPASGSTEDLRLIAQELERLPEVSSAVVSSEVPTQDWENNNYFELEGVVDASNSEEVALVLNIHSMDYGFFETYGVELSAGRFFNRSFGNDEAVTAGEGDERQLRGNVMLNESAASKIGFARPEDAIGRVLTTNGGSNTYTVVGVIKDIYFRSIKFGVRPSIYFLDPDRFNAITAQFQTNDLKLLLQKVENVWRAAAPNVPMEHQFLDEMIATQYAREEGEGLLFAAFSGLAVLVAALGLYGLASFTAERRTKEMGVRKVMGARVRDIVQLMVWQFSKPVLLANLIAWPIAWFVMQDWLQRFEYRLGDGFIIGAALIAGAVALLVAWVTVVGRSLTVARRNPIDVLRYE